MRQRLELAIEHQRAGRTRQAIALYQEVLRETPRDADVMQRLGVALAQLGSPAEGAKLLAASLELKPDRPFVLLNLARALLAVNKPSDALACCERALILNNSAAGAYRLRGTALAAMGRSEDALASFAHAVRLAPDDAGALVDLGVALGAANRAEDAKACFERATVLDPSQAPAHHNLALLAVGRGDHAFALASLDQALALQPDNAILHVNRGTVLKDLGRLNDAIRSYSVALSIDSRNVDARRNRAVAYLLARNPAEALSDYECALRFEVERPRDLIGRGLALLALGRSGDALPLLEEAVTLAPDDLDAHIQLGVALLRLDRYAEAIDRFDRVLAIQARRPDVLNNRGVAAAALGRLDEALGNFIEAAAQDGGAADTQTNVGVVFKSLGDHRQAELAFERALSSKPNDAAASFEMGFLQLTLGELRKGWPLYESRFRVPALGIPLREFDAPRWDGRASLEAQTILVHAEQGLGDTIQFARYLPLLAQRGASVIFEVMPHLTALMASLQAPMHVIPRGVPPPRVDFQCPLLSLPLAFDTQLSSIPFKAPYLFSEPARVAAWASRLQPVRGLRVGIAWQGNLNVERQLWARGRSMSLDSLAPLTDIPGVSLISLQKGAALDQLRTVPFRNRIVDLGPDFDSGPDAFLDCAAVMMNLDLVLTTDSAIAHLAGALARPVWVALHASADWRWLLDRNDSPWYPTMRLFRQSQQDAGWGRVVTKMRAALEEIAGPC